MQKIGWKNEAIYGVQRELDALKGTPEDKNSGPVYMGLLYTLQDLIAADNKARGLFIVGAR